ARAFDLHSGPTRGGQPADRLTLDPSDGFVVLSFLAPIRSGPGIGYAATLRDAAGRTVAEQKPLASLDELGHFVLVCSGSMLIEGDYVLSVVSTATQASPVEEYQFPFTVVRPETRDSGGPR